jgi:hypothetical protein
MSIKYIALNRKDIFAICYCSRKLVYFNVSFTGEKQLYIYM